MQCPKCGSNDTTPIGTSHYVCNNPNCITNGNRTQFKQITDDYIRFPYNQIFVDRSVAEFYRKPYLQLEIVGDSNTSY